MAHEPELFRRRFLTSSVLSRCVHASTSQLYPSAFSSSALPYNFLVRHRLNQFIRDTKHKSSASVSDSNQLPARRTKTGLLEWRTTVSVTLPNTQRFTPERPWEHMTIRLSGVWLPTETISSGATPS